MIKRLNEGLSLFVISGKVEKSEVVVTMRSAQTLDEDCEGATRSDETEGEGEETGSCSLGHDTMSLACSRSSINQMPGIQTQLLQICATPSVISLL